MRYFRARPGLTARLFLLSGAAFLASGAALAQVAVKDYVVIQPIDVCGSTGPSSATGCAPFNILSQSPDPSQATSTTPIGFVDPPPPAGTNINNTRAIWLQAGIDVTFLPIAEYNNTTDQSILDVQCTDSTCTGLTSPHFKALSSGTPGTTMGCKSNCKVPLASTKSNAINMFFVDSIESTTGLLAGFAWLNGNGIAIANNVFSFSSLTSSRFDTLAHEIGHNLGLDHTMPGNNPPAADDVMTAGSVRTVPSSSGCSTAGGALFDLDALTVFGCPGQPTTGPIADQLNPTQESAVLGQPSLGLLPSGFLNPIPNATATAGGGLPPPTTATTTSAIATTSTSNPISFNVTFSSGGRTSPNPPESVVALFLELPEGFQFGANLFTQTGTSAATVFGTPQQLNGNNGGGNSNCLKPASGTPSVECLEILFVPGTFTLGTSFSFMSNIIDKRTGLPPTLSQLECTTPAALGQCLDISFVFSDLYATTSTFDQTGTASSQSPDASATPTVVVPADFANLDPNQTFTGNILPGATTQIPCTPPPPPSLEATTFALTTLDATVCPPLAGGNPGPD